MNKSPNIRTQKVIVLEQEMGEVQRRLREITTTPKTHSEALKAPCHF